MEYLLVAGCWLHGWMHPCCLKEATEHKDMAYLMVA